MAKFTKQAIKSRKIIVKAMQANIDYLREKQTVSDLITEKAKRKTQNKTNQINIFDL